MILEPNHFVKQVDLEAHVSYINVTYYIIQIYDGINRYTYKYTYKCEIQNKYTFLYYVVGRPLVEDQNTVFYEDYKVTLLPLNFNCYKTSQKV